MKRLTKEEREIIIEAAGLIAAGEQKYSCVALMIASYFTIEGDDLADQYRKFLDLEGVTFREEFTHKYGESYSNEELRDMRVIGLLSFAEVG